MSNWNDRETEGDEGGTLAALVALHRRKQLRAHKSTGASPYGQVLEHFERRGKRLAGERLVTEQLIARAFEGARELPPPRVHQELEIAGPLGGRAAGRFRVQNRTSETAVVELVAGDAEQGPTPKLTFEPARLALAPNSAALVRVVADLSESREPGSTELIVECRADGRRDRLWLTVTGYRPDEAER